MNLQILKISSYSVNRDFLNDLLIVYGEAIHILTSISWSLGRNVRKPERLSFRQARHDYTGIPKVVVVAVSHGSRQVERDREEGVQRGQLDGHWISTQFKNDSHFIIS